MNEVDFLELMNEVDDGILERSERDVLDMKKRTSSVWLRVGALAACICIVAAVGFTLMQRPESTHTEMIGGSEAETVTIDTSDTTVVDDIEVNVSEGRGYGLSLVQIDKESPRYNEPYYEREDAEQTRTVTLFGKTRTAKYVETSEWMGSDIKDEYKDALGNTYDFAEDGTFLSYIGSGDTADFRPALYYDKGIAPDINEDEAVALAEKVAQEIFGEDFDKVKFESVEYNNFGEYHVQFYQRLGADGTLLGLTCDVTILADGRVFSLHMGNRAAFRELDESKYALVTKADVEAPAKALYGEDADGFLHEDIIEIRKMNGRFILYVMVETRGGGEDIFYEVTDLKGSK